MDGMRTRNLYEPGSRQPFALSRSKVAVFLECPRCFYLDRRRGIGRPSGPAFSLNLAVDSLLKKEFDRYRLAGEPHPLMRLFGIEAVPLRHRQLDDWRDMNKGLQVLHPATNFSVFGAVDDLWETADGDITVVDYKATSTQKEITLEEEWRQGYKRQIEVYQWLLRGQGLRVSETGYLLFMNARTDRENFDNRLEFSAKILPLTGNDSWVEDALKEAHACLQADDAPAPAKSCEWCTYRRAAASLEQP